MPRPSHRPLVATVALVAVVVVAAACGSAGSHPATTGNSSPRVHAVAAVPSTTASTLPPRLGPGATTVLVLGDSVILGAQPQLEKALVGWNVTFDAKVSRSIYSGISILQAHTGPPPRVVVVHLCTNWGAADFGHQIDRAMAALTAVPRVIWVTCTPWNPRVLDADAAIGAASIRYHNVVVADWEPLSLSPGYTYTDHLHLRTPGAEAMAALIRGVVGPSPAAPATTTPAAGTGTPSPSTPSSSAPAR